MIKVDYLIDKVLKDHIKFDLITYGAPLKKMFYIKNNTLGYGTDLSDNQIKLALKCLINDIMTKDISNINDINQLSIKKSLNPYSNSFDISYNGIYTLNKCQNIQDVVNFDILMEKLYLYDVNNKNNEIKYKNLYLNSENKSVFILIFALIETIIRIYRNMKPNINGGKTRKIYTGPKGGKYVILNGKKKYIK